MVKTVTNSSNIEIILTPNRSLSTEQTQWIVLGVCTFVFIVALLWSMQGAFLVLPFAGLDILLFAYFMFKINREGLRKQVITIDSQSILIQSGITEVEESLSLSRDNAFLVISDQEKKSLSLKLSDSKSYFELGSFLTNADKVETRKILSNTGLREVNEAWWRPL